MRSRPLLLLGNLTAMTITIAALAQALSWTLAGVLIVVSLILPLIVNIAPPRAQLAQHPVSRMPADTHYSVDTNSQQELGERNSSSGYQSATKTEPKTPSRQKTTRMLQPDQVPIVPSITESGVSPRRPTPLLSTPPPTVQGPNLNPTIAKDDYVEYEVELEAGEDFLGEVTADGLVNVYLLDEENMDNLDGGEEFWSETSEEGVETATLEFTATSGGEWFFVVENADDRVITASVKIRKGSVSVTPD